MHVYSGYWSMLGEPLERRYAELISYTPDDGAIYTGPDHFLYDPAGGLAAQFRPAPNQSHAALYFLPVSPMYLCAAALTVNQRGPYRIEELMNQVRFATRNHMSRSYQGIAPQGLFCSTYLRLLRWVGSHPHFDATAARHVWHFSHSFYLTSAIFRGDNRTDARGSRVPAVNSAADPYRVMRPGIFLTQEHRVGLPPPNEATSSSSRSTHTSRRHTYSHRLVLIPFYSTFASAATTPSLPDARIQRSAPSRSSWRTSSAGTLGAARAHAHIH